jgi:hypothetical protein
MQEVDCARIRSEKGIVGLSFKENLREQNFGATIAVGWK